MHITHTKSFNIHVSIALPTLAHMINVYEICLNTTNCQGPIDISLMISLCIILALHSMDIEYFISGLLSVIRKNRYWNFQICTYANQPQTATLW